MNASGVDGGFTSSTRKPLRCSADLQQWLLGRKERRLQGSRAVDDPEDLAGHAGHQAVPARLLLLAQPDRQVGDPTDLVEHDPAIAGHWAENPEPLLPQMLDEVLESRLRQPPQRCRAGAAVTVRAHSRSHLFGDSTVHHDAAERQAATAGVRLPISGRLRVRRVRAASLEKRRTVLVFFGDRNQSSKPFRGLRTR